MTFSYDVRVLLSVFIVFLMFNVAYSVRLRLILHIMTCISSTSPAVWRTLHWMISQPIRRMQPEITAACWKPISTTWWRCVLCCLCCSSPASTPCCTHCEYCTSSHHRRRVIQHTWGHSHKRSKITLIHFFLHHWSISSSCLQNHVSSAVCWSSSACFRVSQRLRVMGSLLVIMLVFTVTAVLVKLPLEPLPFFAVTMVKIVIINCELSACWPVGVAADGWRWWVRCVSTAFGAVLQGSLFGMAGVLPASYTTPIMSGQGMAGSFAAFAMICAIASLIHNLFADDKWNVNISSINHY